jgi:hypothetical protein
MAVTLDSARTLGCCGSRIKYCRLRGDFVREKRSSKRLLVIPAQSVVIYRLLPRASKRGISRFLTIFKATGLTLRQPELSETNRFCRCIQREVSARPRLL